MDRMKTFLKYILWIIGLFILSDFLISVGLNSNYKKIERKDEIAEVSIYQAEATKVNGRIRGFIKKSQSENLSGKYLKIEFYSKRDIYLGKVYIPIQDFKTEENQPFEAFFKVQDVKSYKVSIVDQKEEEGKLELLQTDLSRSEILLCTAFTFLMFW